jgi:hypothetical protein
VQKTRREIDNWSRGKALSKSEIILALTILWNFSGEGHGINKGHQKMFWIMMLPTNWPHSGGGSYENTCTSSWNVYHTFASTCWAETASHNCCLYQEGLWLCQLCIPFLFEWIKCKIETAMKWWLVIMEKVVPYPLFVLVWDGSPKHCVCTIWFLAHETSIIHHN